MEVGNIKLRKEITYPLFVDNTLFFYKPVREHSVNISCTIVCLAVFSLSITPSYVFFKSDVQETTTSSVKLKRFSCYF